MREKENRQFRILSALGIIFVVAGHLGYGLFDVGGLFPCYSFHVFIFLFVSGYFYREDAESDILGYIRRKCFTLLLPYFVWNLFYGILARILHGAGFSMGEELSFKTLFLSPFTDGHQFLYHFPAWFVPALFLVEVINVLMRRVLGMLHLKNEWLILSLCLAAGIATIRLAIGGHVWGLYKMPGRLLLMLPGLQMGRIYRQKLEIRDTLPDGIYFLIVMGAQVLICVSNAGLAFGVVWVTSFANGPVTPYLTVITGIAFWLRVARIISVHPFLSQKLAAIGRGTYSVMMHHAAVFMLVKGVFLPVQPQDVLLCGLRQRAVFSRYQLCIFCRRDRGGKVDLPAGGNRRAASGRPGASGRLAASEQKRRRIFYKKGTEGGTERIQKH